MSEFSLIEAYFSAVGKSRPDVILGVGDDAAIVAPSAGESLAISVDTLIEGVHFPVATEAYDIGWKSLAVNLSDMAAMGAKPKWVTLALTLPHADDVWLAAFSRGFSDLANQYNVQLIGGDTTRGTLSITVQIMGSVIEGQALTRSAAQVGDAIYVTGVLGDAALGLRSLSESLPVTEVNKAALLEALNKPIPRINEARDLYPYLHSAIDISDGLAADLSHIIKASKVGAVIDVSLLPVSEAYRQCQLTEKDYDSALTGGDDYELCFTVAKSSEAAMLAEAKTHTLAFTKIGEIVSGDRLTIKYRNDLYEAHQHSYDHFIQE